MLTGFRVYGPVSYTHLFRILKSYGEVDEIPAEMLKSSLSEQIDSVLGKLDGLLKK